MAESTEIEQDRGQTPAPSRPRWRRIILIAVLVVVAVLVVLEVAYVAMAIPEVGCRLCHLPRVAATQQEQSAHRGLRCSDCHRAPGVAGAVRMNLQAADHFVSWLTFRPAVPAQQTSQVSDNCVGCHAEMTKQVVEVRKIKMSHAEVIGALYQGGDQQESGTAAIPCAQCHPDVAHRPSAGATGSLDPHSLCNGCHDGATASSDCATCHVEEKTAGAPVPATSSTHPADWAKTHGLGDTATCSLCHPQSYCKSCHKVALPHDLTTYMYTHGKDVGADATACYACHTRGSCDACHKIPMPHPAGFLGAHGAETIKRGAQVCADCHLGSGCTACHLRHIHPGVPKSVQDKLQAQPPKGAATP